MQREVTCGRLPVSLRKLLFLAILVFPFVCPIRLGLVRLWRACCAWCIYPASMRRRGIRTVRYPQRDKGLYLGAL